jgi:hypothetical protein
MRNDRELPTVQNKLEISGNYQQSKRNEKFSWKYRQPKLNEKFNEKFVWVYVVTPFNKYVRGGNAIKHRSKYILN